MSDAVTADLIDRLVDALAESFTKQGHVMQMIREEHRGNCLPPGRCAARCRAWRALRDEATSWLEQYADGLEQQPRQMALVTDR